ncbi:MAG: hypothetical protein U5N85_13865 [Arcicella sp.]|nr:hypothetical protein [Arcicella sp.]
MVAYTPGIIYNDLIIMGMRLSEGLGAALGNHVRASNVLTFNENGVFIPFHTKANLVYETWLKGFLESGRCLLPWAGMALDEKRGIVFVPTGSATYDCFGVAIGKVQTFLPIVFWRWMPKLASESGITKPFSTIF